MKRLFIIITILIIAVLFYTNGFVNMTSSYGGDYIFYNKDFFNTYLSVSKAVTLNSTDPITAQLERLKQKGVKGETVIFQGSDDDIDTFLKKNKVKIISTQTVSGVEIIYGYTYRLRGYVYLDEEKVNIQIAKRSKTITIGTPLIFGSY